MEARSRAVFPLCVAIMAASAVAASGAGIEKIPAAVGRPVTVADRLRQAGDESQGLAQSNVRMRQDLDGLQQRARLRLPIQRQLQRLTQDVSVLAGREKALADSLTALARELSSEPGLIEPARALAGNAETLASKAQAFLKTAGLATTDFSRVGLGLDGFRLLQAAHAGQTFCAAAAQAADEILKKTQAPAAKS